jgi:hypothetical protein
MSLKNYDEQKITKIHTQHVPTRRQNTEEKGRGEILLTDTFAKIKPTENLAKHV